MSGQLGQGRGEMLPGVVRTAVDDAELRDEHDPAIRRVVELQAGRGTVRPVQPQQ